LVLVAAILVTGFNWPNGPLLQRRPVQSVRKSAAAVMLKTNAWPTGAIDDENRGDDDNRGERQGTS
jgi:hypothetical protein